MNKCTNQKTQGHGMQVTCGSKEWGEDSNTYYCESCLREKIESAFIDGALNTGASEETAKIWLFNSEYSEFMTPIKQE